MPDFPNPNYQAPDQESSTADAQTEPPPNDFEIEETDEELLSPDELSESIKNETETKNNLTAFAPKPRHARFDSQMRQEEIVLLLRRHPVTQFSKIAMIIAGIFFPILLFASPFLSFLPLNYKLATVIGWYLVLFGFSLESFLTWYFRVFIITNRRAIDVDFYSMVHKDITTAELIRIQDMSVVSTGVFASLIDFGTLYLQTAGQNYNPTRFNGDTDSVRSTGIEFEDIPQPTKVKKIISELVHAKRRKYANRYTQP